MHLLSEINLFLFKYLIFRSVQEYSPMVDCSSSSSIQGQLRKETGNVLLSPALNSHVHLSLASSRTRQHPLNTMKNKCIMFFVCGWLEKLGDCVLM